MLDGTEFFECQCYSDEHTLKMVLDADPEYPELFTSIYLNDYRGFFKRLWVGIKYIFGYKCKYGHWDCFCLRQDDADRMIELIQKYKEAYTKTGLPGCFDIDEHDLSLKVAEREGGKEQVNIAQIKEIQRLLLEELAKEKANGNSDGVLKLLAKHKK